MMKNRKDEKLKVAYFLYLFIVFVGGATFLTESDILIAATFCFSLFLFVRAKCQFNPQIVIILLVFAAINLFSLVVLGNEVSLMAYVGYNLRILTAYFSIKYFGWDFFRYYLKAIYMIAWISIPFYLIQLLDLNFFIKHFSFLNMSGELRSSVNYWNGLIYTAHQGTYLGIPRNPGFTIEPGVFGYLLGFAIILELIQNDFRLSKHIKLEICVGLTTFSTTFYIVLGLLFFLVCFNKKRYYEMLLLFPFVVVLGYMLAQSEIVAGKVEKTISATEIQENVGFDNFDEGAILNRYGMLKVGVENITRFPLGHGLNTAGLMKTLSGYVLAGPNTLMWMLIQWGIIFIFFMPWALNRFFKLISPRLNLISRLLLIVIFAIWLFSCSIQTRDFLFFTILIFAVIPYRSFKGKVVKRNI